MHARRLEHRVLVARVALVVDLDQDILKTTVEYEVRCRVDRPQDRPFIGQSLVLALIEVANDDRQAVRVGGYDDLPHALGIRRSQRTSAGERGVFPRLVARVALRAAALEVDCDRQQAVATILW